VKRRDFITLVGGAIAIFPRTALAQQQAMPVIGFLSPSSPEAYESVMPSFRNGLGEAGYVEGQNLIIEYRWAEDEYPAPHTVTSSARGMQLYKVAHQKHAGPNGPRTHFVARICAVSQ